MGVSLRSLLLALLLSHHALSAPIILLKPENLNFSTSFSPENASRRNEFSSEAFVFSSTQASSLHGSQAIVPTITSATDVSINQVEKHLDIVHQLKRSVDKSLYYLENSTQFATFTFEMHHLRDEFVTMQTNLTRLARGLNGTLVELEIVEEEEELQSKKLKDVLAQQDDEKRQQKIEKDGFKEVDYETGHLKNTTGLNADQLQKLEAVEKKADPAVLHYDMDLLAQVAVLLGVSAMGGILATYFNIPPQAGYVLGGAFVGPSCLRIVRLYKEVETISLFGSIFLLFGHGAAYSPQKPEDVFRKYFVGGMAYILSTVLLVAGVAVYIGWTESFIEGLSIGLSVCFSTTAPLYEHIRENRIQDSSFGRVRLALNA